MAVVELALLVHLTAIFAADDAAKVVVKVNGTSITAGDVEFAAIQQGVDPAERTAAEPKLIERMIDRQLVRAFLRTRKIEPATEELQFQIAKAEDAIRKRGDDPKKVLEKIGYTQNRMKNELGLTLAWKVYIRKTITQEQIKEYFDRHKQELDGTQVRVSHIFLKAPSPASESEIATKKDQLAELRREILAKKLTFAEAAKEHSEAPTRDQGGDVGLIGPRGKLPPAVSQAAFALKVDEISEPVISPLGVHLILVTERHPGDFSLEDVRPVILEKLSQQYWDETVERERKMAKIEWTKK